MTRKTVRIRRKDPKPATIPEQITPEEAYSILEIAFERCTDRQRLLFLMLGIREVHQLVTDNAEFWQQLAVEIKAPKHSSAERAEPKERHPERNAQVRFEQLMMNRSGMSTSKANTRR